MQFQNADRLLRLKQFKAQTKQILMKELKGYDYEKKQLHSPEGMENLS
jgi:hypothetical protein